MKLANFFALVVVAGVSAAIGYFVGTDMGGKSDQPTEVVAENTQSAQSEEAKSSAAQDPNDALVATVNGEEIRESDVLKVFASLPEQYRQAPLAMIKAQLVEQMVNTRIIHSAAETENFNAQAEYTDRVAEVKRQLLQEYYIQKKIEEAVTEETLKAEYTKITADFKAEDEVKARHILLKEEDEAKDVISKLDAGGDFVALAKELSTGPSGPAGGDLGYFVDGRMVAEFSKVAFALEKGAYSKEPVKTQFGWHVILVEDRRATQAPAFDGMRKKLEDDMSNQAVTALLDALKAKATVNIITPEEAKPAATDEAKEEAKEAEKKED